MTFQSLYELFFFCRQNVQIRRTALAYHLLPDVLQRQASGLAPGAFNLHENLQLGEGHETLQAGKSQTVDPLQAVAVPAHRHHV